jgi:hypothetical protein
MCCYKNKTITLTRCFLLAGNGCSQRTLLTWRVGVAVDVDVDVAATASSAPACPDIAGVT